jgi:hypothetical protein
MPDNKEFFDKWEELEKVKMKLLQNIYLDQRVMSTFMIELWAQFYKKPYQDGVKRWSEIFQNVKGQWGDYLYKEHGSINPKDFLTDDENPPSGGK